MPIEIVEHDPKWAARYAFEEARLQQALGAAGRRIEHVGSTSVPALAAKDIVDIQLSVAALDDEASYRPRLEALGYVYRPDDEPAHRFYFINGADGRRQVHLHVCAAGSGWETSHLAFRDLLRRDAGVRAAYEQLKRRLAPQFESGDDYADAKGPFIRAHTAAAAAAAGD